MLPAKRPRMEIAANMAIDALMDNGTMGGVSTFGQIKRIKRRNGNKEKTLLERLAIMERMAYGYQICRWQSVNDFLKTSIGGTLGLSNSGVAGPPAYQWMPAYMFNLSTLGQGRVKVNGNATVDSAAQVGYRQKCTFTSAPSGTNWTWEPISGNRSNPEGNSNTAQYSIEKTGGALRRGANNDPKVIAYERYIHEWSDIKLMFYGAQQVQTKLHYMLVKFKERCSGPLRIYNSTQYDPSPDAVQQNYMDIFWTDFWARKNRNPLISSGLPGIKDLYTVIAHESIVLDPKTTIDKDVFPNMSMVEHYFHPNTEHTTFEPGAIDQQSGNITGLSFVTNPARFGYFTDASVAAGVYDTTIFPDYRANVFLFVFAEQNLQNVTANSSVNLIDTNYDASFDVVIRNKFALPSF